MNDFKRINDTFGHAAGDEVLIQVAARLKRADREGDLVARLGGDEFVVLARHLASAEEATSIALRVILGMAAPFTTTGTKHQVRLAIGIALFPQDGHCENEIMRKADIALYRAQAESSSALRFFEEEMDARIKERDLIERELQTAINEGTVQPHFQPLVNMMSGEVVGFEALARWTRIWLFG